MRLLRSALLLAVSLAVSGDDVCVGIDSCLERNDYEGNVQLLQVRARLRAPASPPPPEKAAAEEPPPPAGLALAAWPSPTGSFVSSDAEALICMEGDNRTVEGALAMRKAAPRGRLYNSSAVSEGGCSARGYTTSLGEDSCYPGVFMYVRPGSSASEAYDLETSALNTYAERWNLTAETTSLMDACTCHFSSSTRTARASECVALDGVQGAWVHHDLKDFMVSDPPRNLSEGKGLMCDGGPFELATRALAVLKSTAQLGMHMHDSIAPVSCAQLGFPHQYDPLDHCFTGLRMSTKTAPPTLSNPFGDIFADPGILESSDVETFLFGGGFKHGARESGLDAQVLDGTAGCHCAPSSEVVVGMPPGTCDVPGVSSPIRDWWKE